MKNFKRAATDEHEAYYSLIQCISGELVHAAWEIRQLWCALLIWPWCWDFALSDHPDQKGSKVQELSKLICLLYRPPSQSN